jgi:hypothetical protein
MCKTQSGLSALGSADGSFNSSLLNTYQSCRVIDPTYGAKSIYGMPLDGGEQSIQLPSFSFHQ